MSCGVAVVCVVWKGRNKDSLCFFGGGVVSSAGPSYEKRIERRTITETAADGEGGGALGNLSEGRARIVKRAAKEFEGKRAGSVHLSFLFWCLTIVVVCFVGVGWLDG